MGLILLGIPQLTDFLEYLDLKIADIHAKIKASHDPDTDGLCDCGEYYIGIGFVAIQQCLTESLFGTGLDKKTYDLGPCHPSGVPYAKLFNAAANWWKHEAEWFRMGEIPKNGQTTYEIITSLTESHDYALSNVLASICGKDNLAMANLVPHLESWAIAVHEFDLEQRQCVKDEPIA